MLDTADLFTDPHLIARGFIHQVDHAEVGTKPLLGWPPRMSGSSVPIVAGPQLGQHTDEVLASELGLDAAAVADLKARGVAG